MWALTLWENGQPLVQWGVVIGASIVAAGTDLAGRRIPNWLTFPMLIGGLVFASAQAGTAGFIDAFAAMMLLALPYVVLFLFANGGAGDAKLMGAIGAWLGVANGLAALGCVALAGVILAMATAIMRGRGRQVGLNVVGITQSLFLAVLTKSRMPSNDSSHSTSEPMLTMPYGLAICTGVCVAAIGVFLWRM
jgi:prepilin peptidase CpaA